MKTRYRYLIGIAICLILPLLWWITVPKHSSGQSQGTGSSLIVTQSGEIVPMFYAQREGQLRYLIWLDGVSESTARQLRVSDGGTVVSVVDEKGDPFVGPLPANDGTVYEFTERKLVTKSALHIAFAEFVQRQGRAYSKRVSNLSDLIGPQVAIH